MAAHGAPSYRARQVFHALYQQGVATAEAMTELPAALRRALTNQFAVGTVAPIEQRQSADGTAKWLVRLADGQSVETVLIPTLARRTVCVSTQVGCAYACAFCASGQAGFRRNLTAGEIVQQVLLVQRFLWSEEVVALGPGPREGVRPGRQLRRPSGHGVPAASFGEVKRAGTSEAEHRSDSDPRWGSPSGAGRTTPSRGAARRVTHVVCMGMGEPLANYESLLKAIRVLNAPEGLRIGARRITISTVGLVPMIERLSREGLQIELSVSLHAPNDALRGTLMPVNAKYPLDQLIPACRAYTQATKRLITFEYILIDHVNDGVPEARQLAERLVGLSCKVNLIPCHPIPGTTWARPPAARMHAFARTLRQGGVPCTLRRSRGLDIEGACGQLRLRHLGAARAAPAR